MSREARMKELREEIARLDGELQRLAQEELRENSPFLVNDIIEWDHGHGKNRTKRRGRVVGIGRWIGRDPMPIVVTIKKDGSNGARLEVPPYKNPTVLIRIGE